jgi:catechol 2,3-dioxygenase-like lactoylglutathione lyase family enzyme
MPLAHLAIGSRDVRATAEFLCRTMGWELISSPANAPLAVAWIDVSARHDRSQQIHVIHVADFEISPFDREFGRHMAVFHDGHDMAALKLRIAEQGGELIAPLRPTPFERFFFREPVNGYVFEVINQDQWTTE